MIDFYIRLVDFSLFRQGEPVQWLQELTNLSAWENNAHTDTTKNSWHPSKVVKLRLSVDEVDFIDVGPGARCTIIRRSPLAKTPELAMYTRHETKVEKGHDETVR